VKFRSGNLPENGNKNRRNLPCDELLSSRHMSLGYLRFNFFCLPYNKHLIKSDFLRASRIGRHSRKIDFSFIPPKHTFG